MVLDFLLTSQTCTRSLRFCRLHVHTKVTYKNHCGLQAALVSINQGAVCLRIYMPDALHCMLKACLCAAALSSAGMGRLLGSTGQAFANGDFPDKSLQGLMFGILCKNTKAGSYKLSELSALLAAWQVTEAWLPGAMPRSDGHSHKLRATQVQAFKRLRLLYLLFLSVTDCCSQSLTLSAVAFQSTA